jgi:toxin ParE1/3/4
MVTIKWTDRANQNLDLIFNYIVLDSEEAAINFISGIFTAIERLENFPRSGRIVPELQEENLREVIFQKYRIIYELKENYIDILLLLHQSQRFKI